MEIDHDKIDEAVLALMWLTLHDGCRAWKSFDWGATDRLYQKGFICDPANNADSDEVGQLFRRNVGHAFRFQAGHDSDLKSAT